MCAADWQHNQQARAVLFFPMQLGLLLLPPPPPRGYVLYLCLVLGLTNCMWLVDRPAREEDPVSSSTTGLMTICLAAQ